MEKEVRMARRELLKASLLSSAGMSILAMSAAKTGAAPSCAPSLVYGNPTFPLSEEEFSKHEKVDVTGKVAVITGASTGIGRVVAEELAGRGFEVVGTSRRPQDYAKPNDFQLWKLDLTIPGSIVSFAETVRAKYPTVHLLVLNAARWYIGRYGDSNMKKVQKLYDTNINGHQILYRLLEPALPRGANDYARVFFTSSIEDRTYLFENPPLPGIPAGYSGELHLPYSVSKTGMARTGQVLYGRFRNLNSNIQVTVFYPGFFINTNIMNNIIYGNDPGDPEIASAVETYRPLFASGQQPGVSGRAYGQMAELKAPYLTSYIINPNPGSAVESYFQSNYWVASVVQEEDRTVRSVRC